MRHKKITIMRARPQPTDEEIRQLMDFETIKKQLHVQGGYAAGASHTIATFLGVAGFVTLLILTPWEKTEPVSVPPREMVSQQAEPSRESAIQPPDSSLVRGGKAVRSIPEQKRRPERKVEEAAASDQEAPEPTVYVAAEPVLGYPHLYEYFNRELRYPEPALRDSLEGILSLSFVINREGNPIQIRIENSPGPFFDEEAMRVILSMPDWKPATVNGRPVPVRISLPITFQIKKVKTKQE